MENLPSECRSLFLLNPMGTAGDVHPYLGMAVELQKRGHQVVLLTNEVFSDAAKRLCIPFVALGERVDWSKVADDKKVRNFWSAWKEAMGWAAINPMREAFAHFKRLNQPGKTCIVSPVWSFAARNAREALGINHVNCVINPIVMRSAIHSPRTPMMYLPDWMPRWFKRYEFWCADRFFIDPVLKPELNRFRKELALPPVNRIMHRWWFSDQLVLGLFDPWMVPAQSDWACSVETFGHPRWDPPGETASSKAAVEFANAGDPPVLFVPGSVGPGDSDFFVNATKVCQSMGLRAIFLDRNERFVPCQLPSSIRHFDYVRLCELTPLCKAIVHCGCAGTLNHAMAAGIPHVIWPRVNDQFDNAARLESLGVGKTLGCKKVTSEALAKALANVLADSKYSENAKLYAAKMAENRPLAKICDRLEHFMLHDKDGLRKSTEYSSVSSAADHDPDRL